MSFVILSGPGDFFSCSVARAVSSSATIKGEFIIGCPDVLIQSCRAFLTASFLFNGTYMSLVSAYWLMRRSAAFSPVSSSSYCWRVMGVFLLPSSFMALVNFQSLLPSLFRFICSIFSRHHRLALRTMAFLCLAVAAFRAMMFSTVGLFSVFSLASAISSSTCCSDSLQ